MIFISKYCVRHMLADHLPFHLIGIANNLERASAIPFATPHPCQHWGRETLLPSLQFSYLSYLHILQDPSSIIVLVDLSFR